MSEQQQLSDAARERLASVRFFGDLPDLHDGWRALSSEHGVEGSTEQIRFAVALDEADVVQEARYHSTAGGYDLLVLEAIAELSIGQPIAELSTLTPQHAQEHLERVLGQAVHETLWPATAPLAVFTKLALAAKDSQANATADAALGADWGDIGLFEKVRRIEEVLDKDIRPMLASDGGGMDLVDLREHELVVQYNGACGSCSSSIGGTLYFVEDTLNAKLGTSLKIIVQDMQPEPFVNL
jgi:Fe-S cluster biogenesis protein NfuA/NifU-like protein involved in Fe-S cluster formation